MTQDHDRLLKLPVVATMLNVSVVTVRRLIANGSLRVVRIGRSIRVAPVEVKRFVAVLAT